MHFEVWNRTLHIIEVYFPTLFLLIYWVEEYNKIPTFTCMVQITFKVHKKFLVKSDWQAAFSYTEAIFPSLNSLKYRDYCTTPLKISAVSSQSHVAITNGYTL